MPRHLAPLPAATAGLASPTGYDATWESLDARPCPAWFDEAKLGIFVHWGLYSVPAWAPKGTYAEWYWASMQDRAGETWRFHERTYGGAFRYQDFAARFAAELFDPAAWADLFARAGARYVIPTTKHHDGYCLWPSTHAWNWNSVDLPPHRDLYGDLAKAVLERGLRMGAYYSLYEWFHPLYEADPRRFAAEHMVPQLRELVEAYHPALIFTDGEWDHEDDVWGSREFLAWLFNGSPVAEEVVVNDRWGSNCRSEHGGYFTTEYGEVGGGRELRAGRKWEENRGIGASFGYNRNEDCEDYLTGDALIRLLVDTVSRGGNLNVNVGPTADGRILPIMQERLLEMGRWLDRFGEAIYGTRPWRESGQGEDVRYTAKGDAVYAILLGLRAGHECVLAAPRLGIEGRVELLGHEGRTAWRQDSEGLRVHVPTTGPAVLKLTGVDA
jgi:alpha-L-fucosidase